MSRHKGEDARKVEGKVEVRTRWVLVGGLSMPDILRDLALARQQGRTFVYPKPIPTQEELARAEQVRQEALERENTLQMELQEKSRSAYHSVSREYRKGCRCEMCLDWIKQARQRDNDRTRERRRALKAQLEREIIEAQRQATGEAACEAKAKGQSEKGADKKTDADKASARTSPGAVRAQPVVRSRTAGYGQDPVVTAESMRRIAGSVLVRRIDRTNRMLSA